MADTMPARRKTDVEFHFKDNRMFIRKRGLTVRRIKVWPRPLAEARGDYGDWRSFIPEYRLINYPVKKKKIVSSPQMELGLEIDTSPNPSQFSKKEAYDLLRQSIPLPYSIRLAAFRTHQWMPLRFLSMDKRFLDLLISSPALAYFLSNTDMVSQRVVYKALTIEGLIHMPQQELLELLHLPGTKSAVKLMRKMAPQSASPDNLDLLRKLMKDDDLIQKTRHLQSINAGILSLLCRKKALHEFLTPKLLQEVSNNPKSKFSPFAFSMLDETVSTLRRLDDRREQRLPAIKNLKQLHRLHTEILTAYGEQQSRKQNELDSRPFPKPPIPGSRHIKPLTSDKALYAEGSAQHNCVGGYGRSVRSGSKYIYSVTAPERATLAIQHFEGRWIIGELFAACNKPVQKATREAVEEWLAENQEGLA